MKKLRELLNKNWFAYSFALCSAVVLYMVLSHISIFATFLSGLWNVLFPIIIGLVIAYILNPIMVFFEKKVYTGVSEKPRHILSVLTAIIIMFLIIAVFLFLLIPSLWDSVLSIYHNLPYYEQNLNSLLEVLSKYFNETGIDVSVINDTIEEITDNLFTLIKENGGRIVSTAVSTGVNVFYAVIGFILAIYFLMGKTNLMAGFDRLFRAIFLDETYAKTKTFFTRCHNILIRFIAVNLLDSLIVALVNALIMKIFGLPFIPLISAIVGVTNLLPTFGPIIGAVIGGFILVLVNPIYLVIFIGMVIVMQIGDGYILKPRLFGQAFGVPGIWILIMVLVFGKLFGVIGLFFVIPVTAIISFLYEEEILPALLKNKKEREEKKKGRKA